MAISVTEPRANAAYLGLCEMLLSAIRAPPECGFRTPTSCARRAE